MSIPYPKKDRGGPSPVSRVGLHIYRDPPKAKFTRKYEPVNVADVMYMANPDSQHGDPTRINEAIKFYARGKNPMVEIDYGAGQGATNPYKIEVVRPPLQPAATLNAISRPDVHQNYAIQTLPHIQPFSVGGSVDRAKINDPIRKDIISGTIKLNKSLSYYDMIDQVSREANNKTRPEDIVLRGSIRPTASYSMDPSRENNFIRSTAVGETNVYTVTANPTISRQTINPTQMTEQISANAIQDLRNFAVTSNATFGNIIVYDPKTQASLDLASTVKDKHYIAVTASQGRPLIFNTNDGKQISLKDYSYSVVNTAIGNPQLIIQVNQPEVVLERNTPLFTASSNIRGVGDADAGRMGDGTITLTNNVPLTSVTAGFSSSNGDGSSNVRQTQNQVQLTKQGSFGEYTRNGMINQSMRQSVPTGVGKNEKYRTVAKEGHKMSIGRSY